jgi:hypothetical protein
VVGLGTAMSALPAAVHCAGGGHRAEDAHSVRPCVRRATRLLPYLGPTAAIALIIWRAGLSVSQRSGTLPMAGIHTTDRRPRQRLSTIRGTFRNHPDVCSRELLARGRARRSYLSGTTTPVLRRRRHRYPALASPHKGPSRRRGAMSEANSAPDRSWPTGSQSSINVRQAPAHERATNATCRRGDGRFRLGDKFGHEIAYKITVQCSFI